MILEQISAQEVLKLKAKIKSIQSQLISGFTSLVLRMMIL